MESEFGSLWHGDCLQIMNRIPNNSIDMVLCDLPYGTTKCKWDTIIPFEPLWDHYKRIIKGNGAIVLFGTEPFSSYLRMSNISEFKYDWIWDKVRPSGFQIAKFVPMKRHEILSVFSKGTPTWYPIKEKREKAVRTKVYGSSDSSPLNYNDGVFREYEYKNPQSILVYYKQGDGKYIHPTQKPTALCEYMIRTYTKEGDTVLDNCAGSGTTGIACINTNRKFIMIENDNKYFNTCMNRIQGKINEFQITHLPYSEEII